MSGSKELNLKLEKFMMTRNEMKFVLMILLLIFPIYGYSQNMAYWEQQQIKADDLYRQGDYAAALSVYLHVAEETASSYSSLQVAWIYERGLGVERNCKEAARWYTHAANSNDQVAQNNLFALYSKGCSDLTPNDDLAIQYLKMSAEAGNSRAQSNLAYLYAIGEKVKKNIYAAYDLAQQSVKQNDIAGIVLLSQFYIDGTGVPENPTKAYALLNNAATMEVGVWDKIYKQQAQLMLGELLFKGEGISKDIGAAYRWFLLASSGPDKITVDKADEYLKNSKGLITNKEIKAATKKASSSAHNSTLASAEDLITALYQSLSDDRKEDAIRLAETLVSQNNSRGQVILGLMYIQGYSSIPKDLDEGYILFKRACTSGEWEACAYQVESLIRLDRVDAANQLLNNIASKTPETEDMQNLLAKSYYYLDRNKEAENVVQKILLNDPTNEPAKSLLAKIK